MTKPCMARRLRLGAALALALGFSPAWAQAPYPA